VKPKDICAGFKDWVKSPGGKMTILTLDEFGLPVHIAEHIIREAFVGGIKAQEKFGSPTEHLDENKRIKAALEFMESNEMMGMAEYKTICPNVCRKTLQRDLKHMIDAGLIVREGESKLTRYRIKT